MLTNKELAELPELTLIAAKTNDTSLAELFCKGHLRNKPFGLSGMRRDWDGVGLDVRKRGAHAEGEMVYTIDIDHSESA